MNWPCSRWEVVCLVGKFGQSVKTLVRNWRCYVSNENDEDDSDDDDDVNDAGSADDVYGEYNGHRTILLFALPPWQLLLI